MVYKAQPGKPGVFTLKKSPKERTATIKVTVQGKRADGSQGPIVGTQVSVWGQASAQTDDNGQVVLKNVDIDFCHKNGNPPADEGVVNITLDSSTVWGPDGNPGQQGFNETPTLKPGDTWEKTVTNWNATGKVDLNYMKVTVPTSNGLAVSDNNVISLGNNGKTSTLVRGTGTLKIALDTSPPNSPAQWSFTTPSKTASSMGPTATLDVTEVGSYTVTATIKDASIVWTLNIVDIPITGVTLKAGDPGIISVKDSPGSDTDTINVSYGGFSDTQGGSSAFFMSGTATISGGEPEKIVIGVIQTMTASNLTRTYDTGSCVEALKGGAALRDVQNKDNVIVSDWAFSGSKTTTMFQCGGNNASSTAARNFTYCDSPSTNPMTRHHKDNKSNLNAISGGESFKSAVCAYSKEAPNCIIALAGVTWSIDYGGKITVGDASSTGKYDKGSAGVKIDASSLTNIGFDAAAAGYVCSTSSPIAIQYDSYDHNWT
jgi:hypothetical protein